MKLFSMTRVCLLIWLCTLVPYFARFLDQDQSAQPHCIAQSVTCLAIGASLTADSGVASSVPARSHTFVEIDHEIISTVILLPQEGLLSVTSESMCTNYWLTASSSLPRKKCG